MDSQKNSSRKSTLSRNKITKKNTNALITTYYSSSKNSDTVETQKAVEPSKETQQDVYMKSLMKHTESNEEETLSNIFYEISLIFSTKVEISLFLDFY